MALRHHPVPECFSVPCHLSSLSPPNSTSYRGDNYSDAGGRQLINGIGAGVSMLIVQKTRVDAFWMGFTRCLRKLLSVNGF